MVKRLDAVLSGTQWEAILSTTTQSMERLTPCARLRLTIDASDAFAALVDAVLPAHVQGASPPKHRSLP
jgi:hypothetical protein